MQDDRILSYAQNKEDIIIEAFFPDIKNGFYVDIGASHPVVSSVTKMFYEKGWRGINIEPSPEFYGLLVKDRPEDINVNVGISDKEGKLNFREYEGWGYSTFSQEMKDEYEKDERLPLTNKYKDYDVKVKTLKQVLDEYSPKKINFLKIDIEGFEYEALIGNDWDKYRPELICIESNHIFKDWKPILKNHGYEKYFFDGLNDYYLSKESIFRAKYFSYPSAVTDRTIIQLRWHQEIGALRRRIELDQQLAIAKQKELERHINILQAKIEHDNRIRHQVSSLARNLDHITSIQIEKLNKATIKRKGIKSALPLSIPETTDKKTLLKTARLYDFDNFYSEYSQVSKRKNYPYKAVSFTHRNTRKVAKASLITGYKALRKVKNLKGNK